MTEPSNPNYARGILWMITAGLLFVVVTVIVRHLGSSLPATQGAFIRYLFGLVLMAPVIPRLRWKTLRGGLLGLYAARGISHGLAVGLWFYAMARLPVAEVTSIGYVTPLFTAAGAILILRERAHFRRIAALVVGFAGALIILRPGFQAIETAVAAQLLGAALFAVSYLFAKKLSATEDSAVILAMLTIFCTLTLLPGALLSWREPTVVELAWLLLVAVFATLGHYAMTRAFTLAPLTVTQPFAFLQLVWAVLAGYLLFAETPDAWVLVGGVVIVGAVSYITHREALARAAVR